MRYLSLALSLIAAFFFAAVPAASATDITGTWQGVMVVPGTGKVHRIMTITKDRGTYDVVIHSVDESEVPIVTHNVSVNGNTIVMKFDMNSDPWMDYHRVYRAKLSSDGNAIDGTWAAGSMKIAMNFRRTGPVTLHQLAPVRDLYIAVEKGVKDEVLDWGGTGRPVMLLAGQGVTARGFRNIIPDLIKRYHVYSVTRRGYGNSSKPPATNANYSATRLGEDVLTIMDALNIQKPILIGHSLAGEELSYIGTKYPQKVSALIYLDAAYWYAFDSGVPTPKPQKPPAGSPGPSPIDDVIDKSMQQFSAPISVPILAIYANPHQPFPGESKQEMHEYNDYTGKQIAAFRNGQRNAKVIVIANADHFVYISNTTEVLKAVNAFISTLPST